MIFGKEERILYGNRFNGTKGNGYQPIKKEMTNEEWLRQASTEELADVLTEIACESYYDGLDEKLPLKHNCKHFMKWLKEIHE